MFNVCLVIVGLIVGFIAGAITMFFVYRNNVKFFQKLIAKFEAKAAKLEAQAKAIRSSIHPS